MPNYQMQTLFHHFQTKSIGRREFMTRAATLGLSTGAIGTLLQACGSDTSSTSDSSGQITVWTWPDNDKTFAKTIPYFERKFPKLKVKVQAFQGNDYYDKLLASIVAGSGPDVAMVEIGSVAKFKSKPGFVDLSQAPYNIKQYQNNYAPYSWNYATDAHTGHIFALPKNTGPGAMFYRRDVFEKAGLPTDPDKVHELLKDWDSLLSIGKSVTIKGKQWMISSASQIFNTIIAQAGISYYDTQGNLQISNPDFRAALQYAKNAWDSGIVSSYTDFSPEWSAALQSGTVATQFWGNWFGGNLKSVYATNTSGKWGVTYAPAYKGNSAYDSGGDFIGILESSSNKAAAWEFCKFVTQDLDSLRVMYQTNDLYPAWRPALDKNWLNFNDPFYAGQQLNPIFSTVQSHMIPFNTNPNDPVASSVMTTVLTNITAGHASIDSALAKATLQINSQTGH